MGSLTLIFGMPKSQSMGVDNQICLQLGLSGALKDCDIEQKELLRDAFEADPAWSSKASDLSIGIVMEWFLLNFVSEDHTCET